MNREQCFSAYNLAHKVQGIQGNFLDNKNGMY